MNIASAATAFPKHYYPQKVLSAAFRRYWDDKLEDADLFERLHAHVGVDGRYLVRPREDYEAFSTFGETNDVWIQAATDLAEEATSCALARAGLKPSALDAIFFVSITGVASPSIDARLANRMGLPSRIRRTPIFGLGCVAGAAGLARAADYVRAYPAQTALLVAVELCSLTIQRDDLSIANLISSGLFGDGAAAVIVAGAECNLPGPRIVATRSIFYPGTEDVMGWNVSEKGFRIVLSPEVPEMARKHLGRDTDEFLAGEGLERSDIGCWLLHTGGPKVLEAMEEALNLRDGELSVSWDCLRKAGNLSSASVLQVLEETMERRRPAPGTWGLLAAMGPGFCSELVLLRW
ncbi:MAG: 3-oxoacyl-[acyl-carrier-protein] synthase III C-terminal domain-containing protein [Bryobacteraceae bacterium]|jgi:alkylresorcinol/alkylpyrone synthase